MAISDWELWACANEILRQHGAGAAGHAVQRISDLTREGDLAGARAWEAIHDRIRQLEAPPPSSLD